MKLLDRQDDPTSFGRVMLDRYIIRPWQLSEAITKKHTGERLGDTIVRLGHASREDVERAWRRQQLMRAHTVAVRSGTAHNVIDMAEAQNVRLSTSIGSAYNRADAVVQRFRKSGV
jgi:hypothetical protein